jgi:hypothetical protein
MECLKELTLRRLLGTTYQIYKPMLPLFQQPRLSIRLSLARELCRKPNNQPSRVRQDYRRATNEDDLRKLYRFRN